MAFSKERVASSRARGVREALKRDPQVTRAFLSFPSVFNARVCTRRFSKPVLLQRNDQERQLIFFSFMAKGYREHTISLM